MDTIKEKEKTSFNDSVKPPSRGFKGKEEMAKYYRMNPFLGCSYEITEKEALKKINSRNWVPVWDDYYQCFSNHTWYNLKDRERDFIILEK